MEEIYGPEDIEKLLLSKDFSDLYPEERDYVLRHMDGQEEYEAMRHMLLDVSSSKDELTPPVSMRDELIGMHEAHHKTSGFKIWLNSLFTALVPKVEWQRPAMQLAGLAGIILLVMVVYRTLTPGLDNAELAFEPEKVEKSVEPSIQIQKEEFDSPQQSNGTDNSITELESVELPAEVSKSKADNEETSAVVINNRIERSSLENNGDKFTDITAPKQVTEIIEDENSLEDEVVIASELAETKVESIDIEEIVEEKSFELEYMAMDATEEVQSDKVVASAPSSPELTAATARQDADDLSPIAAARVPSALLSQLFTAW